MESPVPAINEGPITIGKHGNPNGQYACFRKADVVPSQCDSGTTFDTYLDTLNDFNTFIDRRRVGLIPPKMNSIDEQGGNWALDRTQSKAPREPPLSLAALVDPEYSSTTLNNAQGAFYNVSHVSPRSGPRRPHVSGRQSIKG